MLPSRCRGARRPFGVAVLCLAMLTRANPPEVSCRNRSTAADLPEWGIVSTISADYHFLHAGRATFGTPLPARPKYRPGLRPF